MTPAGREDARLIELRLWLEHELAWNDFDLAPASEDASFRRYFRVTRGDCTAIVMDAPPDKEDVGPYLKIAGMLTDVGVHAPRVLERNASRGFLLLTDLGSTTYLMALADRSRAPALYEDAIEALVRIQSRGGTHALQLPPYDERLLRFEMSLFPDWYLARHLEISLEASERAVLDTAADLLAASALEQPRVFVHRDYHSRNLMVFPGDNPGILDFQDAVHGPVTYDLVSLLRDCYIEWPLAQVEAWVGQFRRSAAASGLALPDDQTFMRWFDLMGVQRHLKAIGIFARLWHRDGKPGYLKDIPRTLAYVRQVCSRDSRLAAFAALIEGRVVPAVHSAREGRRA